MEKSVVEENYYTSQRLYSFVTPNRMLYRIDHKNESDHEVPILGKEFHCCHSIQIVEINQRKKKNSFFSFKFKQSYGAANYIFTTRAILQRVR